MGSPRCEAFEGTSAWGRGAAPRPTASPGGDPAGVVGIILQAAKQADLYKYRVPNQFVLLGRQLIGYYIGIKICHQVFPTSRITMRLSLPLNKKQTQSVKDHLEF